MINRYQCGIWLQKHIGWNCFRFLPEEVKRLLYDWKMLDEIIEANLNTSPHFYDYSFIIAPVYKAVEGFLWKIAQEVHTAKKDGVLGNYFNEEYTEKITPLLEK